MLVDPDELPARQQDPRFFVPACFGPKGRLRIDLDAPDTVPAGSAVTPRGGEPDPVVGGPWSEVEELLGAGLRCAAPKRLLAELDASA